MKKFRSLEESLRIYFSHRKELYGNTLFRESPRQHLQDLHETSSIEAQQQTHNTHTGENEEMQDVLFDEVEMLEREPKVGKSVKPWHSSATLEILHDSIHTCTECALGHSRANFVFGTGNPNADIMVIGEAPGAKEDEEGKPFVGRSGQLLTKILKAINFERDDVFIANILKCRPPENRTPTDAEAEECEPYLHKQIELIQPKFILALGLTALNRLLRKKHRMADIRGKKLEYHGTTLIATYHPAALLRNPNLKRATWEDVKFLRNLYEQQQ
jgi:DNA polymerase